MKKILAFFASLGLLLGLTVAPAFAAVSHVYVNAGRLDNTSSTPSVVAADGLNKWFMYNDSNDTVDNTLGSFVTDASSPNGVGSIEFTLGASPMDRKNIATYQFSGITLSSITAMGFTAYSHSGVAGANESPFLNFNVDLSGSNTWQKRLVYVPSANMASVPQDKWNTFDAIDGGNALWTWSGYYGNGNKWPDNVTTEYRTWNNILSSFPNARILPSDPWLGVRVGEPGPTNYTADVASFTLGTSAGTTEYDFAPYPNVNVTIVKYLDGSMATASSASNASFPMVSSWMADNLGSGSGSYTLGPTGYNNANPYEATTSDMTAGASYKTNEVTNDVNNTSNVLPIDGTCQPGMTQLVGYTTGDSLSAAQGAEKTATAPSFTNLTANEYVIIWNKTCPNATPTPTMTPTPTPVGPPTYFAQCRDNGWKTFNNPTFKNQGRCIDYVEDHLGRVEGNIRYTAYSLNRRADFEVRNTGKSAMSAMGMFWYTDANHARYQVLVSDLKVSGKMAWFAGKVIHASNPTWVGQWLIVKVSKNSPSQIWGSFTNQTTAENDVMNMTSPADGPFNITGGNLNVR